ncbi:8256_t:CDS:10, partial [Paraglomus occultum]
PLDQSTEWLELLNEHPIFSDGIANENIEFVDGKQSCLAFSNNELYVAIGSKIRVLNLLDLMSAFVRFDHDDVTTDALDRLNEVDYVELQIPEIGFQIRSIVPDSYHKARMIAVAGDSELVVVTLPEYTEEDDDDCRAYTVGTLHEPGEGIKIMKVAWHPLSEYGSHLVVLTEDGVLKMYDVFEDLKQPEQIIYFSSKARPPSRYASFDSKSEDAASFCFGEGEDDWGPFVIYVVMKEGDIRAVCPFLPNRRQAENSYNLDKKAYSTLYELYRRQAKWICSVMNQIEDYENEKVVINPPTLSEHIEIQGPFEINPKPITSTHTYEATDIIYLDSDPVGVIIIAYDNGFVNAYIQFERIEGAWQLSKLPPYCPSLTLYECIDLDFSQSNTSLIKHSPSLVRDALLPDRIFVYHGEGLHAISVQPWLRELKRMYEKGIEAGDISVLQADIHSDVIWVATTQDNAIHASGSHVDGSGRIFFQNQGLPESDPLVGLCLIHGAPLCYAVIMLTKSRTVACQELALPTAINAISSVQLRPFIQSEKPVASPSPAIEALSQFFNSQGLPRRPQIIQSRNVPDSSRAKLTPEMTASVVQLAKYLNRYAEAIITGLDDLDNRTKAQAAQLFQLSDAIEGAVLFEAEARERLLALRERQRTIEIRAMTLLQKLLHEQEPASDEQQQIYLESLERLKLEIDDENGGGLRARINELEEIHESLRGDYHLLKPQNKTSLKLSGSQLAKVREALSKETEMIEETKQKIDFIQDKLEQLRLNIL